MHIYLSIVALILTIVAAIATVGYNATINSHLSFKQKQDNTDYINTQRSYRPPAPPLPKTESPQAPKNR
ncbi:MAG: hypothetical protein E7030_01575 [Akkermansiaceae bacterium]|nr:hypothetical protein [Akkermansiaceae bacterium]